MLADDIRTRLANDFPAATDILVKLDENHALIEVIDAQFAHLSAVKSQQRVYSSIIHWIENKTLHAVTIRTRSESV